MGHARIVRELGMIEVGGGVRYPVRLVFNTNPARAPGAFGPFWHIPLLSSTVVAHGQYKLYWDGPDEYRQFFKMENRAKPRRGRQVYTEHGNEWRAEVSENGGVRIEATRRAGWYFRYKDGRLREFRLGEASDPCRVAWSGRGWPLHVTNQTTARKILSVEYERAAYPKKMFLGERVIRFEMGEGELTSPDGRTGYRSHRVRFLRSLSIGEGDTEFFAYGKAVAKERTVTILNEKKKKVQKTRNLSVNRMEISVDLEADPSSWVEWEARSGFITADSGAEYEVANDAWDPNISEEPFPVTPDSVRIDRQPADGGRREQWSYDWNSGLSVYTDPATGERVRHWRILSPGPANGKMRRREIFRDGDWVQVLRNSFDARGRLVRSLEGDDVRILRWEDFSGGRTSTEFLNGALVQRTVYRSDWSYKEREVFEENGDVDRIVFGERDGLRTSMRYLNGEPSLYQELNPQGRLVYEKRADGREQFIEHYKGGSRMLYLYPDGSRDLLERVDGIIGYEVVEAPERIAAAIDFFQQSRKGIKP